MKLNQRRLLLIAIGFVLVAALALNSTGVIARVGNKLLDISRRESKELSSKLLSTQARVRGIHLEELSARKATLEQQLTQTTKQLDTMAANLSQPINKTYTYDNVSSTAKTYNLEITKLTLSGPNVATLAGMNASAVLIMVTVEGNIVNLVSFITELNTFKNGAVDSVVITNPETAGKKPSADVKLTLYTVQSR